MPYPPRILSVGAPIWYFDTNRRVYRDRRVDPRGAPIWREHWVKMMVTADTPRKWIIGHSLGDTKGVYKIDKAAIPDRTALWGRRFALDEEHIAEIQWIEEYRNDLANAVRACEDVARLRAAAAVLYWSPLS